MNQVNAIFLHHRSFILNFLTPYEPAFSAKSTGSFIFIWRDNFLI